MLHGEVSLQGIILMDSVNSVSPEAKDPKIPPPTNGQIQLSSALTVEKDVKKYEKVRGV